MMHWVIKAIRLWFPENPWGECVCLCVCFHVCHEIRILLISSSRNRSINRFRWSPPATVSGLKLKRERCEEVCCTLMTWITRIQPDTRAHKHAARTQMIEWVLTWAVDRSERVWKCGVWACVRLTLHLHSYGPRRPPNTHTSTHSVSHRYTAMFESRCSKTSGIRFDLLCWVNSCKWSSNSHQNVHIWQSRSINYLTANYSSIGMHLFLNRKWFVLLLESCFIFLVLFWECKRTICSYEYAVLYKKNYLLISKTNCIFITNSSVPIISPVTKSCQSAEFVQYFIISLGLTHLSLCIYEQHPNK